MLHGARFLVSSSDVFPPVQEEVTRLAGLPEVRSAFGRFRFEEPQIAGWQMDVSRVASPPFGETHRAEWLAGRFREIGLANVELDEVGSVFGVRPGYGNRVVALSAHIDTVFPATTPLNIRQEGARLYGPGVSDNGAGIAAMLAVASVLGSAGFPMPCRSSLSATSERKARAICAACGVFSKRHAGAIRLLIASSSMGLGPTL